MTVYELRKALEATERQDIDVAFLNADDEVKTVEVLSRGEGRRRYRKQGEQGQYVEDFKGVRLYLLA